MSPLSHCGAGYSRRVLLVGHGGGERKEDDKSQKALIYADFVEEETAARFCRGGAEGCDADYEINSR